MGPRVGLRIIYLLHDDSIVHRVHGVRAPGKGAVGIDQHAGNGGGIAVGKGLNDHLAGLFFVLAPDLRVRHGPGTGDFAVEIIRLRRPHGWNSPARLGESGGPAGVGVDDAAAL